MESLLVKDFLHKIDSIYKVAQKEQEDREKRGEDFNIFTTLNLGSNEVRLHSAFLAELLNPKGKHGMGDSFLTAFLETLGIPSDFLNTKNIKQNILERAIGPKTATTGGRIDIILEDGASAIIIENKIYAGDQENQLLRYSNFGKNFKDGYHLLYLTLYGYPASEFSTGKDELDYQPISYSKDITKWLCKCAMLAYDKPLVRETIKQYISLIKLLTGTSMNEKSLNELVHAAVDDIEATSALIGAQDSIGDFLRKKYLFKPLKEFATKSNLDFKVDDDKCSFDFSKKDWKGKITICSDYGKQPNWRSMYIGVSYDKELNPSAKLDCLNSKSTSWWPHGWEYLPNPFCDLNSPNSYVSLKQEDVANWIEDKVIKIMKEATEKGFI